MSKRMPTLDISQRILAMEPGAKGNSDVSVAHRAGFRSAQHFDRAQWLIVPLSVVAFIVIVFC